MTALFVPSLWQEDCVGKENSEVCWSYTFTVSPEQLSKQHEASPTFSSTVTLKHSLKVAYSLKQYSAALTPFKRATLYFSLSFPKIDYALI